MAGLARVRAEGKQLGRRPVEQAKARKVKAALELRAQGLAGTAGHPAHCS
jgi:hypothetical protein